MKVMIKQFDVAMEIKNKGIEIDVSDPKGHHLGDLVITKTKVTWCAGRIRPEHGRDMSWEKFIAMMEK